MDQANDEPGRRRKKSNDDNQKEYMCAVDERNPAQREAMNNTTWQSPSDHPSPQHFHLLPTIPSPEPHLPLRKASAQRLAEHRHGPRPLFSPSQEHHDHDHHPHQLRGFHPSPVELLPHLDNATASNEHAFAGRAVRRPSKLPLGSLAMAPDQAQHPRLHHPDRPRSTLTEPDVPLSPSSPRLPPTPTAAAPRTRRLRHTRSLGEGLKGLRHRLSSHHKVIPEDGRHTPDSVPPTPSLPSDDVRSSLRSAMTTHSSQLNAGSPNTERSSQGTGNTSPIEVVHVYPSWPDIDEDGGGMTVDEAIGMYEEGFESAKPSFETQGKPSLQVDRRISQPSSLRALTLQTPHRLHRRSQSAGLAERLQLPNRANTAPPHLQGQQQHTPGNSPQPSQGERPASESPAVTAVPRDRYGFKKVSHYITVEQYDAWNAHYSSHLERRSKKWHVLMRSYGLDTDKPFRFPPKSDKIKRYVRKGVPAEFRGAAWYWYAGGPHRQAMEPGLYWELLEQVAHGKLGDNDREHIERDLNRTFPDNVRFKPDPTTISDVQAGAGGGGDGKSKQRRSAAEPETDIMRALRRVLQAFAVHNPNIGYCQSLNFIAGLLLLFLDEDEEKSFILLEIVTSVHLPGTHGVALEGANIDIAVLMSCIKDALPGVWAKLDDNGSSLTSEPTAQALRLPTVSLCTTSWFMSLFVGTLPIESVLRVWDCLFFEGSKTLFRIALAIFKAGERQILAVHDPMEIFQVVQTIPRSMLDINGLVEVCFKRRGGFGHVSQELIERRREERRRDVREGVARMDTGGLGRLKTRWKYKSKVA